MTSQYHSFTETTTEIRAELYCISVQVVEPFLQLLLAHYMESTDHN